MRRTIVRNHLYVYAVVGGRPGPRALTALPRLPDGSSPRVVALDARTAIVVADVPAEMYNESSLEARLADLAWVAEAGAAHHAVADALAASYVVLPFRVFTLFSSEATAVATLRKTRAHIAQALARVKGRQEWVLRIGRPDPARRDAPPPGRPDGPGPPPRPQSKSGAGFLRAKADARRADTERNARVAAAAARVFDILRDMSDQATARAIEPGTNLLLDAAFLIPKRRTAALQRTLTDAAADLLREGCPVSLTGPWPPYSFASMDDENNG